MKFSLQASTNNVCLVCYGWSGFPHVRELEPNTDNVRVCTRPCEEARRSSGLDPAVSGL